MLGAIAAVIIVILMIVATIVLVIYCVVRKKAREAYKVTKASHTHTHIRDLTHTL